MTNHRVTNSLIRVTRNACVSYYFFTRRVFDRDALTQRYRLRIGRCNACWVGHAFLVSSGLGGALAFAMTTNTRARQFAAAGNRVDRRPRCTCGDERQQIVYGVAFDEIEDV